MTFKQQLRDWSRRLKRDAMALWIAARDPRTPWYAKVVAGSVAAYVFSPIDPIPNFIPVLGWLDDSVVVPLGVVIAIRLIPPLLFAEFRAEAAERLDRPSSIVAMLIVIAIWACASAAVTWLIWRWSN
jgi:uncharacterized membrane protein YkvA (DUF1232 family)